MLTTVNAQYQSAGRFVRAIFACNGDIDEAYRVTGYNASLPRGTWELISDMIVAESQKRLVAVNDVRSRPALLESVPIYVTVHTSPVESDLAPARQAMNTMVSPQYADIQYSHIGVPLPMVFEDTQLDMRTAAAPVGGVGIQTRWVALATQKVAEAHELNLFNGNAALGVQDEAGNLRVLVGYTTHASRNIVGPSAAWASFAVINTDFESYKAALRADYMYGPYMVYVGSTVWSILQGRNTAASERTYRQLLLDDGTLLDIKLSQDLTATSLVMVALEPNVVTWVQSADIQASDWDAMGIFGTNVRVWSIGAPHVKATYAGRSGVVHSTAIAAS